MYSNLCPVSAWIWYIKLSLSSTQNVASSSKISALYGNFAVSSLTLMLTSHSIHSITIGCCFVDPLGIWPVSNHSHSKDIRSSRVVPVICLWTKQKLELLAWNQMLWLHMNLAGVILYLYSSACFWPLVQCTGPYQARPATRTIQLNLRRRWVCSLCNISVTNWKTSEVKYHPPLILGSFWPAWCDRLIRTFAFFGVCGCTVSTVSKSMSFTCTRCEDWDSGTPRPSMESRTQVHEAEWWLRTSGPTPSQETDFLTMCPNLLSHWPVVSWNSKNSVVRCGQRWFKFRMYKCRKENWSKEIVLKL